MNNKGVGAVFCLIAAILAGARYLSAAVFMSGVSSWSADLYRAALDCIGPTLQIAAIVALVVGVCFLVLGFLKDGKGKEQ